MQEKNKLYLELVVSAYHTSGFLGRQITREVLEGYLEIIEEKKVLVHRLKRNYYRITKEDFKEIIDFESFKNSLSHKLNSLDSILSKLKPNEFRDLTIDKNSYRKLKSAYDFYVYKTGYNSEHPIKLYCLKKPSLEKLANLFIKNGKHSIELRILSEVKDYLALEPRYVPVEMDIKVVEKVADACREIYDSNNKIPRGDIYEMVLNKYHITSYEDLKPDEYEKKVLKVSKQWVRDNEEDLDIW